MALKIGSKAPDFELEGTGGKKLRFYRDIDQVCILYFYPKDFTPGCISEACSFRDDFDFFKDLGIPVYGISRDNLETHRNFIEKYKLPYELLSDKDGKVSKLYKSLFPVIKMNKRVTYLVDRDKKIIGVFDNLFKAEQHVEEMRKALK